MKALAYCNKEMLQVNTVLHKMVAAKTVKEQLVMTVITETAPSLLEQLTKVKS